MQLYHGTYLKYDNGQYFVDIPENIIATSDFKKYGNLNVYLYVPKKENGFYLTDEIQVCITPRSFQEIEKLYYFELSMDNIPGAFSKFLELFKEQQINILECRAIDSVYEMQGKVELIATIDNDELIDGRTINSVQNKLNKYYKEKLGIEIKGYKPIILKKPIDKYFIKRYNSETNLNEDVGKIKLHNDVFGNYFPIELPYHVLQETIKEKKPFLGITYLSEGNYILVKFKSTKEIIVPITVEFKSNKPGLLDKVITPLAEIGVNLRLIHPVKLEHPLTYKIYFNIENTKLKLFDEDSVEAIIKEHVQQFDNKTNIIVVLDKDFYSTEDKGHIDNEFIKKSNEAFSEHLIKVIKNEWLDRLSKCNSTCKIGNCQMNLEWSKTKEELANLNEQINNSSIEISIPEKIKKIKRNRSNKCTIQDSLQILYQNINAFIAAYETPQKEKNNSNPQRKPKS
ncbi:hypothetical protein ACE01N_19595 [Saccharicrinis sp. FJH2]|uniref:hypothetical protein n=1 Tax=Saccharicrinis sp. FJH65 TaxID=3344659 RepID=UPI0035F47A65